MLKLGLMLGYSGKRLELPMKLVEEAEQLGFDSVWTAEAYGSDAVTAATWILARTERIRVGTCIMQMPSRTPALAAMTAMSLSHLSGNRFICGLGASGPQVVEGWHGVPYGKPVTRTREYVAIMRAIMARKGPVTFDGELYHLPATGSGTTGLGKPLKSILEATPDIPIYSAAITPAGLTAAAEVADGVFPIWQSPEQFGALGPYLEKGFACAETPKSLANFDVAPGVTVVVGDDVQVCLNSVKPFLALYIGGMGARSKNFYKDYATRMGYGDAAERIQDLYLAGDKDAATAAVPDELVDEIALVGPEARIGRRARVWLEASERGEVGTLMIGARQPEALAVVARAFQEAGSNA